MPHPWALCIVSFELTLKLTLWLTSSGVPAAESRALGGPQSYPLGPFHNHPPCFRITPGKWVSHMSCPSHMPAQSRPPIRFDRPNPTHPSSYHIPQLRSIKRASLRPCIIHISFSYVPVHYVLILTLQSILRAWIMFFLWAQGSIDSNKVLQQQSDLGANVCLHVFEFVWFTILYVCCLVFARYRKKSTFASKNFTEGQYHVINDWIHMLVIKLCVILYNMINHM